jgi:hypothetical protein
MDSCRANEKPRPGRGFQRNRAAVRQREKRVVRADADVVARAIRRAALAHQDVPGEHLLAAELLDAEALRLGLAPVLGTAACFLVCHLGLPFALRPP